MKLSNSSWIPAGLFGAGATVSVGVPEGVIEVVDRGVVWGNNSPGDRHRMPTMANQQSRDLIESSFLMIMMIGSVALF